MYATSLHFHFSVGIGILYFAPFEFCDRWYSTGLPTKTNFRSGSRCWGSNTLVPSIYIQRIDLTTCPSRCSLLVTSAKIPVLCILKCKYARFVYNHDSRISWFAVIEIFFVMRGTKDCFSCWKPRIGHNYSFVCLFSPGLVAFPI